jgi:predicted Zn-dependent protease
MVDKIDGRRLRKKIHPLLQDGRDGEARKLVRSLLRKHPKSSTPARAQLLDILLEVELWCGHHAQALAALKLRRALGFRTKLQRRNAGEIHAQLLMNTGQWQAARSELTELLSECKDTGCLESIEALASYVKADERCRQEMVAVLGECYAATKQKLGIKWDGEDESADVSESIKKTHALVRASSKRFQELMLGVHSANTQSSLENISRKLSEHLESEPSGYFREQIQVLMERVKRKT